MLHSNPFAAANSRWYPKILKRNLQPVHRWIAVHKNINYCRQNKKVELPVFYNPSYNLFCRRMRIQKFALFLSEIDEITIPNPVLYRQYVIFYCICKRYFPPFLLLKCLIQLWIYSALASIVQFLFDRPILISFIRTPLSLVPSQRVALYIPASIASRTSFFIEIM